MNKLNILAKFIAPSSRYSNLSFLLKKSQDNNFILKWSNFIEEANDNLPYGVKFLPIGMDEYGEDYQNFVKENMSSFQKIESIGGGSLPVFLGHGTRGSAFNIGGDKILKFMQDPYEFNSYEVMSKRRSQGGDLSHETPHIFDFGTFLWNGNPFSYWVIMEKLIVDNSLIELEKSMLLDMLSMILATLWFQPDSKNIFAAQTTEHGESLKINDLEKNWIKFKAKAIRSIGFYGFLSQPFDIQKFEKLFKLSPECLEDFRESGGNRDSLEDLSIWVLESDLVQDLLKPYLTQIMLNVAHGYLDFQSQNLGWRMEEGGHRPIFFDPGYDFESMTKELQEE
jgi:hypothetical protein